jgi:hypothetical protein
MDRDFVIAILERLYVISSLLDSSLMVASECEHDAQKPTEQHCLAVGTVLGVIHSLLTPLWQEHPNLARRYLGENIHPYPHQANAWLNFDPQTMVLDPRPMPNDQLSSATALRLLSLYETCFFQLNYLLYSAQQHNLASSDMEKLQASMRCIADAIHLNLTEPLLKAFPEHLKYSQAITEQGWEMPLNSSSFAK